MGFHVRIEEILARRSDLSTFLVHLCRTRNNKTGKEHLESILRDGRVKAKSAMGHAVRSLERKKLSTRSQRCVCFSETPLEHVALLLGDIDGRVCAFEPYGIAITKLQGRREGVNPVWYIDITPGHDWLTKYIDQLVEAAILTGDFDAQPFSQLAPLIEQMGEGTRQEDGRRYRKDFAWEREWRIRGDLLLASRFLILSPEGDHDFFRRLIEEIDIGYSVRFIDPSWSLERMIASLAGYPPEDV